MIAKQSDHTRHLGLYSLRRHRFIGIGVPTINIRPSEVYNGDSHTRKTGRLVNRGSGALLPLWMNWNLGMENDHIRNFRWDVMTYSCPSFNGSLINLGLGKVE